MEHINRIELQGHVGTVRTNEVSGKKVVNFSLATEYFYKKDGSGVSETTWHNIVAWEGKDIQDMDRIAKGVPTNTDRRRQTNKYTNAKKKEKQVFEVLATKLRIVKEE